MSNQKFILNLDELENYDFPFDELFELQVNHNDVKYEFQVRLASTNNNLICFGSGAYQPEKIILPLFNRLTWESDFKESVIFYNDPTLYEDPFYKDDINYEKPKLILGWGVGKNNDWYLLTISEIIKILAKKRKIEHENILFFGSSGGGFTSILLSIIIKNSSAIVNNPQICCINFDGHYDIIKDTCFDQCNLEKIESQYKYRFDTIEMIKQEQYFPNTTYIINILSDVDFKDQFLPFIKELQSLDCFDSQITAILYANDNGHDGVFEKEATIKLIQDHFLRKSFNLSKLEILMNQNKALKKELDIKKSRIAEIQTSNGWINYKIKNILYRIKKHLMKTN